MYSTSILVDLGCHNKTPQIMWFKQQIYFLTTLEARKSKTKVLAGISSTERSLPGLPVAYLPLLGFSSEHVPVLLD